jgi:hypothetical protein
MVAQWELARDKAHKTLDRMSSRAEERLSHGVYTEGDAVLLKRCLDGARIAYERLVRCLDAFAEERPSLAVAAWHSVEALLDSSYKIGGLSEISESADIRVVTYEARVRKPKRMRGAKQEPAATRMALLDNAILACVNGDVASLSSYQDNMRPPYEEVIAKLDESLPRKDRPTTEGKVWPAVSTVRRRIKAIKARQRQKI